MSTYDFNLITAFANSAPSNEIEAFPDYDRGLGIALVETDGKPEMKGLNGLFSLLTVSLLALKQRGILTWTTGFEYKQGAFVVESDRLYQAKIDNTSKQPSLSQNDWQVWASVSDIDVDINGNIIKTAKAGGAFTLKVEDASTTVKGVARFATPTEVISKSNVSAAVTPKNVADMFVGGFDGVNDGVELPNGLTIKWGYHNPVSNIGSVSFKKPFNNNIIFGMCNLAYDQRTTSMAYYSPLNSDRAKIGFIVTSSDTMDVDKLPFTWFAIGY